MAALDGSNVFGYGVHVDGPKLNPRREQRGNYPGLNGTESIDMGDQGGTTIVTGRLVGPTVSGLIGAMQSMVNFWDGNPHIFTDHLNYDWAQVKIENIEWEPAKLDPTLGYSRRYTCRLFHLVV